jgi:6-methylsalicylate decarboxylase
LRTVRRVDIHQHLWPEALLSSLARRTVQPRLRGGRLELAGEPPAPFDPRAHDPVARAADGPERILVAPSSPLGIEWLPEAEELLDAFHDGVLELGGPFELWAGLVLADATPERVDSLLSRGAIGLSLPAGALCGPAGIESLGPGAGAPGRARRAAVRAPGAGGGLARVVPGAHVVCG